MGLTTNLAEVFELNEASGNLIGAIAGTVLTETGGTIASTTGKVGNCRDFERNNAQYFTIADNALFSLGTDTAFALAGWINLESKVDNSAIASKYDSSPGGNSREYFVDFDVASNRFRGGICDVGNVGANVHTVAANGLGVPSLGVWYFVAFWHDPVADNIYCAVNANTTPDVTAHSTGTRDGTAPFMIGGVGFNPIRYTDGLVDQVLFYKGGFPTAAEWTAIYNSGNGMSYADMVAYDNPLPAKFWLMGPLPA